MPPSESMRWAEYGAADEVDDYIRSRRERRARRAEAGAGVDLLGIEAESTWDTAASARSAGLRIGGDARQSNGSTPSVVRGELLEEPPAVRRTVVITGRGAERYPGPRRSYSASLRPHERAGFRPDRVAMWAFLLAVALMTVAFLAPR